MKWYTRWMYGALLLLFIAGCAAQRYSNEGLRLIAEGQVEEGLANLERATKEEPGNAQYRLNLIKHRSHHIGQLLASADDQRNANRWSASQALYKQVLAIEPRNQRASEGLEAIEREQRYAPVLEQAKETLKKRDIERALALIRPILSETPAHVGASELKRQIEEAQIKDHLTEPTLQTMERKPVSLEFRDANLKMVFEALARSTGVNFILDKDVRPDLRTTIFLRQASLEDAIELILQTNRLEKKVLNSNTILIYPNSPEKLKEYQELVVKGFYLANADVKQTQAMLKEMLKTRDSFIDEKLNLLMIRDTPQAVRLAEKLIAMHDLHEPEVMLEVEVLEVKRARLMELGIQWPTHLTLTPIAATNPATINDLRNLNSDRIATTLPSATINLRREIGDANILANPRIRARNREKAKIMIGDRVPTVSATTTINAVSETIQYLDVGIKLEVEPNIHLQDEVAIKVGLEVSSLVREIRTPAGTLAYQIGSRSASTVLRLKDGETQVLAGLISDEDRSAANRVPGIGDIPILGRLFANQRDDWQKTEIILSITPRIVRSINRPDAYAGEFWSGTEVSLRSKPLILQPASPANSADLAPSGSSSTVHGSATGASTSSGMANTRHSATAQAPTAIGLSLQGPTQAKIGEPIKVAIRMKADGGVRSLPFQVGFDSSAFEAIEVSEGPFFKQNEAKTNLSTNIDQKAGKVYVSVVRSGIDGAKGDDAVATLTLRPISAKPDAQIRILAATPISIGDKTITPAIAEPLLINVSN